jgi:hypothetical protein
VKKLIAPIVACLFLLVLCAMTAAAPAGSGSSANVAITVNCKVNGGAVNAGVKLERLDASLNPVAGTKKLGWNANGVVTFVVPKGYNYQVTGHNVDFETWNYANGLILAPIGLGSSTVSMGFYAKKTDALANLLVSARATSVLMNVLVNKTVNLDLATHPSLPRH